MTGKSVRAAGLKLKSARPVMPVMLAALLAGSLTGASTAVAQAPQSLTEQVASRLIVQHVPGLDRAGRLALRADAGARLQDTLTVKDVEVLRVDPADRADALAALRANPDVVWAEKDVVVHAAAIDPYLHRQWGLENLGTLWPQYPWTAGIDVGARVAWQHSTGAGVTVAVVDSGVTFTPDLQGAEATNPGESGNDRESNGIDDDNNGYVDDVHGWDWVQDDNAATDVDSHGTGVAGIIAARRDNGIHGSGLAPDANIMSLRALGDTGSGDFADILEAFDYAGRMGIPVVNASLGGRTSSPALNAVIESYPDTLFVAAAGNSATNVDVTPFSPCAESAENLVCVGAHTGEGQLASFSNYGRVGVDLLAPGQEILTEDPDGSTTWLDSGTSQAAPHGSATAALILQVSATLTPLQVRSVIVRSVLPWDAATDVTVTGGRLSAAAAVDLALAESLPPVEPPPVEPPPVEPPPVVTPPPVIAQPVVDPPPAITPPVVDPPPVIVPPVSARMTARAWMSKGGTLHASGTATAYDRLVIRGMFAGRVHRFHVTANIRGRFAMTRTVTHTPKQLTITHARRHITVRLSAR